METSTNERAFIDNLLDNVKTDSITKSLKNRPLKLKVSYLNYLLKLSDAGIEKVSNKELTIKFESDFKNIEFAKQYTEYFLALLAFRYSLFGLLNQYPKQFIVSPIVFEKIGDYKSPTPGIKVRDVDRLIMVTHQKGYSLILCFDFMNENIESPGVVLFTYTMYGLEGEGIVREVDLTSDFITMNLQNVIDNFFSNGDEYDFQLIEEKRILIKKKVTNPYLASLWVLMTLSSNFSLLKDLEKIDNKVEDRMYKSLIFGLGYSTPEDPLQKERPVPIGHIDDQRLVLITNQLNTSPLVTTESKYGQKGIHSNTVKSSEIKQHIVNF